MTQERLPIPREGMTLTKEELQGRLRLGPEMADFINSIFTNEIQRFILLGLVLQTIGIDKVVRFGNLADWKAAIADLEHRIKEREQRKP
jgi:hypothetical protein